MLLEIDGAEKHKETAKNHDEQGPVNHTAECWLEVATVMGTYSWSHSHAHGFPAARGHRRLLRTDWFRYFWCCGLCGRSRPGGARLSTTVLVGLLARVLRRLQTVDFGTGLDSENWAR